MTGLPSPVPLSVVEPTLSSFLVLPPALEKRFLRFFRLLKGLLHRRLSLYSSLPGLPFPVLQDFHNDLLTPARSSYHLTVSQIQYTPLHNCTKKHWPDIISIRIVHVKKHKSQVFFFYIIIRCPNFSLFP